MAERRRKLLLAAQSKDLSSEPRSNTLKKTQESTGDNTIEQPPSPPIVEEIRKDVSTNGCYMAAPTELTALPGKKFAFVCMDALQTSSVKKPTTTRFAAANIDELREYDGVIVFKYTKSSSVSVETYYKRFCEIASMIGKDNVDKWRFILSKQFQYEPPAIGLYRMALAYFVGAPESCCVDIYAFNAKKSQSGTRMIQNVILSHSGGDGDGSGSSGSGGDGGSRVKKESEKSRQMCPDSAPAVPPDADLMFKRMRAIVGTHQTGSYYVINEGNYSKKKYVKLRPKTSPWYRSINKESVSMRTYLQHITKKHKGVRGFIVAVVGPIKTGKSHYAHDLYTKWSKSPLGKKFGVKLYDDKSVLKQLKTDLRSNAIYGSHNSPDFIAAHPDITTQNAGSSIVVISKDSVKTRQSVINIGKACSLAVLFVNMSCNDTRIHKAFNRMQSDVNFPYGSTVTTRVIENLKTKETVIIDDIPKVDSVILANEEKYGICYQTSVVAWVDEELISKPGAIPWYFNLVY